MNTPCVIDGLIYHQAAYIPMKSVKRAQFDVRQVSTGRRLAVVDSWAYDPVTVDGTDLIFETSSPGPGAKWALSRRSAPTPSLRLTGPGLDEWWRGTVGPWRARPR